MSEIVTPDALVRARLDGLTRQAVAPVRLRDAFPGQPIGVDPSGRAVGSVNPDGSIIVSGVEMPLGSPYRDALGTYVLLKDDAGNPIATIDRDGQVLIALLPASVPDDNRAAPDGAIAYLIGAEGSRTAWLWIRGVVVDTRIAADQDIIDVLAVTSTRRSIELLTKAASGKRQVSVPLTCASTLLSSVAEISHVLLSGQSNMEGYISPSHPDPAITTSPLNPGRAIALTPGERLLGNGQGPSEVSTLVDRATLSAFVDLVAKNQGEGQQTVGPTLAAGLIARASSTLGVLVSNAAIGGTSYLVRKKGFAPFQNLMLAVERGATIARLSGRAHVVRYYVTIDGESDRGRTEAVWQAYQAEERSDIDEGVKAINGQPIDVIRVTDQMGFAKSGVTLAQLSLAIAEPNHFICVGPKYHLAPAVSDDVHLSSLSRAIWGYAIARAINRKELDGVDPIPLHIGTAIRTGVTVVCTFAGDFTAPVVIDTERVNFLENYGLTWIDDGDGNTVQIVDVPAPTANQVTVTLSAIPTGSHPRIGCARTPDVTQIGPMAGARSCFRDSSADTCTVAGTTYPLFRWAAHWETPVTAA